MIKIILQWQYKRYCEKGFKKDAIPYSFEDWLLHKICGKPYPKKQTKTLNNKSNGSK